jgi:hypothetical protein
VQSLLHDTGIDGGDASAGEPAGGADAAEAAAAPPPLVSFDDLSRESRAAANPDCFEGLRVAVTQHAAESFYTSHTLRMGGEGQGAGYEAAAAVQVPRAGR